MRWTACMAPFRRSASPGDRAAAAGTSSGSSSATSRALPRWPSRLLIDLDQAVDLIAGTREPCGSGVVGRPDDPATHHPVVAAPGSSAWAAPARQRRHQRRPRPAHGHQRPVDPRAGRHREQAHRETGTLLVIWPRGRGAGGAGSASPPPSTRSSSRPARCPPPSDAAAQTAERIGIAALGFRPGDAACAGSPSASARPATWSAAARTARARDRRRVAVGLARLVRRLTRHLRRRRVLGVVGAVSTRPRWSAGRWPGPAPATCR